MLASLSINCRVYSGASTVIQQVLQKHQTGSKSSPNDNLMSLNAAKTRSSHDHRFFCLCCCLAARRKVKLCHRKWRLRSRYCDDDLEYLSALSWSVLSRYTLPAFTLLYYATQPAQADTSGNSGGQCAPGINTMCHTRMEWLWIKKQMFWAENIAEK